MLKHCTHTFAMPLFVGNELSFLIQILFSGYLIRSAHVASSSCNQVFAFVEADYVFTVYGLRPGAPFPLAV